MSLDIHTLADIPRHFAAEQPDAVALVFEGRETTYAELESRSNRVANRLIEDGLQSGDRVALLAKNSDLFFELVFGASKVGVVLVPVNFRLAPPEVQFVINDARAEIVIVDDDHAEVITGLEDKLETVRKVIHLNGHRTGWDSYAGWRDAAPDTEPDHSSSPDDVAVQMYTSGTTGLPKGAQITHRNWADLLPNASRHLGHWGEGDVNLVCMPLFHVAGNAFGIIGLYRGVKNIVLPEVVPSEILRLIEEERVTKVLFVPAVILFLLQAPECATTDFSSLDLIIYGASPIPLDLLQRAMATMKCDFIQVYGLTETTGMITYLPAADHDPERGERMKSCGIPMDNVALRIVGPDGRDLPPGEVGEIVCRSDQVMKGYWNLPEATEQSIRGDWFHTGDAGYLDGDGYLYIHDRIKDMIISGGENVYPAEVESALFAHEGVADVAVIGMPDDKWGEAVMAIVVRAGGSAVTDQELRDFARTRIAGFKVPKTVVFAHELPRNPSGKLLKHRLRAQFGVEKETGSTGLPKGAAASSA